MEQRASARFVVDLKLQALVGKSRLTIVMYDASTGGCMIEVPDCCVLSLGEPVLLDLPSGIGVEGEVVWIDGGFAGLRFIEPLHETIIRHLGYRRDPKDLICMSDHFGRPLPDLPPVHTLPH